MFVCPTASSSCATSSLSSYAWRETLPRLCAVCSPPWAPRPPASLHTSSSFISTSLKRQQRRSWRSLSPHSSATPMQHGSRLMVRRGFQILIHQKQKKTEMNKNKKTNDFLPPLSRCCPSEAWCPGQVCSQGSEMLRCCLHWCKSKM